MAEKTFERYLSTYLRDGWTILNKFSTREYLCAKLTYRGRYLHCSCNRSTCVCSTVSP